MKAQFFPCCSYLLLTAPANSQCAATGSGAKVSDVSGIKKPWKLNGTKE